MTFNPDQCQAAVALFREYKGGSETVEEYHQRRNYWEQRRRNKAIVKGFEFGKCNNHATDKIDGVGYCSTHVGIVLRNSLRCTQSVDTTLAI